MESKSIQADGSGKSSAIAGVSNAPRQDNKKTIVIAATPQNI